MCFRFFAVRWVGWDPSPHTSLVSLRDRFSLHGAGEELRSDGSCASRHCPPPGLPAHLLSRALCTRVVSGGGGSADPGRPSPRRFDCMRGAAQPNFMSASQDVLVGKCQKENQRTAILPTLGLCYPPASGPGLVTTKGSKRGT